MKLETPMDPKHLLALLTRRIAEKLELSSHCPANACRRNRHCTIAGGSEPPCRHAATPERQARFDQILAIIKSIRDLTLWPEPSRNDDLRAAEGLAIDILSDALPLTPDFAIPFRDWLRRYNTWPTRRADHRLWMKLAREEVARCRKEDERSRTPPVRTKIPG